VMAWRRTTAANLRRALAFPTLAAIVTLIALIAAGGVAGKPLALALFSFAAFTLAVVVQEFWRGVRARRAMSNDSIPLAVVSLVRRNRRRYGGYLVHAGVVLLLVGVAASSTFQDARDVKLAPGERARVGDYEVEYLRPTGNLDVTSGGSLEKINLGADLRVRRNGGEPKRVHTERSYFPSSDPSLGAVSRYFEGEATSEVGLQAGFRRDFWGRFQRTSKYVALTTYGTVSDAERAIAIVRAIHRRVRGTTPDGTPYSADDPHLLMWVHVAEVDSFLRAFQAFGDGALTPADADEYVRQAGTVAARLGVIDPPSTVAELKSIMESFLPELSGTGPAAREASSLLLLHPPLTGLTRAGYHVLAAGAVAILPPWARTELRLPALPVTERTVIRPLGRSAMRTLRWALSDSLEPS